MDPLTTEGAEHRLVDVMGTVVTFDVRDGNADPGQIHLALARAEADLHRADFVFSTWKANSPVSRLRRGEIEVGDAPPEVADVLELCRLARQASGGWFDPWATPDGVDPTGLVKGWAAQRALARLAAVPGLEGVMVNAGGDIACSGQVAPDRPWRVGIRSPEDAGTIIATVDGAPAVATSGAYERGAHIYRPAPVRSAPTADDAMVTSASVVGPDLWMADALATGLAAGGVDALAAIAALPGYHALIVLAGGRTHTTDGSPFIGVAESADAA